MVGSVREDETSTHDIVEAHCYVVTTGKSSINSYCSQDVSATKAFVNCIHN